MSTRNFARIFGILFLLVGAAGFVPPLMQPGQGGAIAPGVHHELLLGMFPMNCPRGAAASSSGMRSMEYFVPKALYSTSGVKTLSH